MNTTSYHLVVDGVIMGVESSLLDASEAAAFLLSEGNPNVGVWSNGQLLRTFNHKEAHNG